MKPLVVYEKERTLIDRQTLALLTGRSIHTIRARCPIATHQDGRALYDMEQTAAILEAIPTRQKRPSVTHQT